MPNDVPADVLRLKRCPHCDYDDFDVNVNPGVDESAAAGNCNDGIDNDCDGLTDAADPDCP